MHTRLDTPASFDATREVEERLLDVLRRHVSPPTARAVLDLALQRARLVGRALGRPQLEELVPHLERGIGLFVTLPEDRVALSRAVAMIVESSAELPRSGAPSRVSGSVARVDRDTGRSTAVKRALAQAEEPSAPVAAAGHLAIRVEEDVARVRTEVRRLAGTLGFTSVEQTKLATIVSELARNIVMYAGSGEVAWKPLSAPQRGLEITASDSGPGIPNLDVVMGGSYRSRHGMGLGLRGVKSLAHDMSVQTSAGAGTRVVARMYQDT